LAGILPRFEYTTRQAGDARIMSYMRPVWIDLGSMPANGSTP
jgi:hypothetical protein